jgi:hypothetical protein
MSSDRIAIAFVALTIVVAPIAGQSPAQIKAEPLVKLKQGDTPVPGQCLSKEQLDLIAALNALHRPTVGLEEGGDDPIPFDPHYLVGSWRIDGFLADSALGDGGEFSGTETVRQNQIDACTYESTLQGKAPDGAFTIKATMAYDPRHQYLVRLEDDSRGYHLLKMGHVGGDAGGYFAHTWAAAPVVRGPSTVRLRGRTLMWSPDAFRVVIQVSEDNGPFTSLGTLMWERTTPSKP